MDNGAVQFAEINIDSSDADTTGKVGFATTDWPVYFKRDIFQTIVALKVLEITLPFSYYVVNSLTNVIPLRWNNIESFVTIPPGNYTPNEMVATVNPLLVTAIAAAGGGGTLVLSYSIISNKFTFTFGSAPANSRITFNVNAGPVADVAFPQNTPAYMLGFYINDNPFGTTFQNLAATTTAAATSNLSGPDYLVLRSNLAGHLGNNYTSTSVFTPAQGVSLATVPINVNRNEVVQWWNNTKEYFSIFPESISRMEFYFTTNDSLTPIEFNGRSFRIKLGVMFANSNVVSVQNNADGQRSSYVVNPYLV